MDLQQQQQQQQQREDIFTVVFTDESFFFYDCLVRRVWVDKKKRPIVRVTGSHQHLCISGATSMKGKQLFRQYDNFNGGDTFLIDYLNYYMQNFHSAICSWIKHHLLITNQRRY
jgi:hypothetical protein